MKTLHKRGKSLAELEDCFGTGRTTAAEYPSDEILFCAQASSASFCAWSIFYSLAAEPWADRGNIAFQITFMLN